jgi:hypothetical protein
LYLLAWKKTPNSRTTAFPAALNQHSIQAPCLLSKRTATALIQSVLATVPPSRSSAFIVLWGSHVYHSEPAMGNPVSHRMLYCMKVVCERDTDSVDRLKGSLEQGRVTPVRCTAKSEQMAILQCSYATFAPTRISSESESAGIKKEELFSQEICSLSMQSSFGAHDCVSRSSGGRNRSHSTLLWA